jgi:hypothetical protein
MPPLETMDRKQDAVLWEKNGVSDDGEYTVTANAVALKVRWEDVRREVVDAQGNTIGTDATVVVNRRIEIGSWLWPGKLSSLGNPVVPPTSGLFRVIVYNETPDIKNRNIRRTVTLMRSNDTLPIA